MNARKKSSLGFVVHLCHFMALVPGSTEFWFLTCIAVLVVLGRALVPDDGHSLLGVDGVALGVVTQVDQRYT